MKKAPYCPPFMNMLYMMGNCDCFPTSRRRMVACVMLVGHGCHGSCVGGWWWWIGLVMTWVVGMQWPCQKPWCCMDFGRFLGGWSGVVNDLFVVVVDCVVSGLLDGLVWWSRSCFVIVSLFVAGGNIQYGG